MAHEWTNEELTKFYEGVNSALKKLQKRITRLDSSKADAENLSDAQSRLTKLAQDVSALPTATVTVEGEKINLSGLVTFTDLETAGTTTINGGNITTGLISADYIDVDSIFSQSITTTSFELASSQNTAPTFTLSGEKSYISIDSAYDAMQGVTNYIDTDAEIMIRSGNPGGAIILDPGSETGASGYSGVAIVGSITAGAWEGDTIAVAHGGTGATTAAKARENLGIESGTWTPTVSGCTSYKRQQGWYTKVGNVVTVGWDVYCSNTTSGTMVMISGLPYTPSEIGWGGGDCSGYTGAANQVFTGWQVNVKGVIFGKGQTGGTAGTRSEGFLSCGGGQMYVGGTMTYTTTT